MGGGGSDPDSASPILQEYHRLLWSKPLPDGQTMVLSKGNGSDYLNWNGFRFASDSIIVSFRYQKNIVIIDEIKKRNPDYKSFYEKLIRDSYTIGGAIIFPKHQNSINQRRGTDKYISDRWDLTMECIRLFYKGKENPLYSYLEKDASFFDLFVDFKGYVDFFFLQDCVSDDYQTVDIWEGKGDFSKSGLPDTAEDYLNFIKNEQEFLRKRNQRIADYCNSNDL